MNEIIVSRRQIIEHNRSIRYELNICIMQTDKLNLISVSDINEAFVLGGLYLAGHQGTKERLIMKRIILASNNKDKIKEVKEILTGYDIISIKEAGINVDVEENGTTFEENALIKARAIMKLTGEVTMADDSGLEIDYLNKEPGVYSARYMGHDTSYDIKNAALLKRLEGVEGDDRSGRFVCAIAVCFPDGREIVKRGTMEGLIAKEIKGNNGFGYDPIVYLPEYGKTSAELDPEEKNRISHRGKALALIKDELDKSEEMYAEDNDNK